MEGLEAANCLDEVMPDLLFGHLSSPFLMLLNKLQEVPTISKLHYNAKVTSCILEKGLFVTDHILVLDGGENSDFI